MSEHFLNDVLTYVPSQMEELTARKLQFDAVKLGDSEADAEIMNESYKALANEFDEYDKPILARNCRKRAEEWQARI